MGANRSNVVEHNRFPEAGGFGESNVAGDDRLEDFRAEVFAGVGDDLAGEIEASVVHGEEDAIEGQVRIYALLNAVNGVEELGKAFQRIIFALDRDKDGVRGGEHVDGEESERGRAVDEDEVIAIADWGEGFAHSELSIGAIDELYLGAGEVGSSGRDVEVRELNCAEDDFVERALADECIVDGAPERFACQADSAGRVALWIAVDEEGVLFGDGEAGGEVDCGGGFPDPAFLVCNCDDSGHAPLEVCVRRRI